MLSLRIALRYLFSRKSHSAVNIISFISLAGVAVATVAIVCVLSVFNGFTDLAMSRISMMDPQLQVTRTDGRVMEDSDSVIEAVKSVEGTRLVLPTLTGQALAIYHDRQLPVRIKGVPAGYDSLTGLRDLVIDGTYIGAEETTATVTPGADKRSFASLSVGVASQLASPAGYYDLLGIYVPRRLVRINPANPLGAFAADSVVISSVFSVNQPEYDTDLIIMPLDDVRGLLEYDNAATAIEIALADDMSEAEAEHHLQKMLGPDYSVKNRMEQQQQAFRMISVEKWISFLLLAFILIIASFNIISTLSILIIEKEDNMRTMAALGAPHKLIARIFMLEGWLITLGGGVLGIILGVALCLTQQNFGVIKLAGDAAQLSIEAYPVKVLWPDLIAVFGLVMIIGLLSTAATKRFVDTRV